MSDTGKRLTIGLLTNQLHTQVFEKQWQGVVDAAQALGVNLIVYPGQALNSPFGFERQANAVFDLVDPAYFDGLILWTGALDWFISKEELQAFVQRYASVPLVCMETPIADFPVVTIGNYQGMWDLVQHLIVVHDYQRIAFVAGPKGHNGMKDRYQAYCDCLPAHGLELNMDLVVWGDFSMQSGATAVSVLLDDRQQSFDAVVVANDKMALGAMQALQSRNINVPWQIAVVGFDYDETSFPPLTTVFPPFYEMGRVALEICVSLINGVRPPAAIEMPTELVIRRSCGCLWEGIQNGIMPADSFMRTVSSPQFDENQIVVNVRGEMLKSLPLTLLETLVKLFLDCVYKGDVTSFLVQFDKILLEQIDSYQDFKMWQEVVSRIRLACQPYWSEKEHINRAEDIFHQVRLLLVHTERWLHEYERVKAEQMTARLHDIGNVLITAFGMAQLKELIMDTLPGIGITRSAVMLGKPDGRFLAESELLLVLTENGRYSSPADCIWNLDETVLPPLLHSPDMPGCFIVAPLYFRTENLGLLVMGVGPQKGIVYETLRAQISSAVKRALLLKELQMAQVQLEARVEMSTAELRQEIQERRQTAEALRESEATMRALLSAMPDAIFLIDEELRFLNFIPAEGFKTAVSLTEYLGLSLYDVFPPELADQFLIAIPEARQASGILLREIPIIIGRQERHYEARFMTFGHGNVVGIIRDITERKENEAAREQLITELEAKNAELERFTYTVSHDLKSPLVTIKGFLGFLERDSQTGNMNQMRDDILRIRQAADQMQDLLDDLLELSRVGRLINQLCWTPLSQIVADALSRVEGQIVAGGVSVTIQPDLPEVYGDAVRLTEVVQNLLDNSVKYMGRQAAPHITIGAEKTEQAVRFFVQDNGVGIETRYHEKIFGLFDRLDQTTEGTGVGLALVKRIVELHGGQIWVESQGDQTGSTFYVMLPTFPQSVDGNDLPSINAG